MHDAGQQDSPQLLKIIPSAPPRHPPLGRELGKDQDVQNRGKVKTYKQSLDGTLLLWLAPLKMTGR